MRGDSSEVSLSWSNYLQEFSGRVETLAINLSLVLTRHHRAENFFAGHITPPMGVRLRLRLIAGIFARAHGHPIGYAVNNLATDAQLCCSSRTGSFYKINAALLGMLE